MIEFLLNRIHNNIEVSITEKNESKFREGDCFDPDPLKEPNL
jgi:hypothetical protein